MPIRELPTISDSVVESAPEAPPLEAPAGAGGVYRIGADDELEISVYGESELATSQRVRPDGKIAFPLVGDVQASGLTPDELRGRLTAKLSRFVNSPHVTVVVTGYNSRKVFVLGEVATPGIVPLTTDITLLEGVSKAGGITENADLRGSLLVRQGHVLPVSFERLFRQGDVSQNLVLTSADVVLIPNITAKKVFVLGEVRKPLVASLQYGVNLIESIALAGGFTLDAERDSVLVVRGGLADPTILQISAREIVEEGRLHQNIELQPGDIVYVPRTFIADVDLFFRRLSTILQPIVLAETGLILGPDAWSVLTTGETLSDVGINVSP